MLELADGILTCSTVKEFTEAKQNKINQTTLPYDTIEFICDAGLLLATMRFDKEHKRWEKQ